LLCGLPFHRAGLVYGLGRRFALLSGLSCLLLGDLFCLLPHSLERAPALHFRIMQLIGPAAGIDLIVMGEIGNPSRTRNNSSFQLARLIFTLPARHCELNGPNRVILSPLSGIDITVKLLRARTR
jgi:hypothetical protein